MHYLKSGVRRNNARKGETRAQARMDSVDWIEGYFNWQRLHTLIDLLAPVDYEAGLVAA
ncbi:integrase catalytic subunit [Burkholderia lata]|uniref:Integrase catalytic subunit n=1 Tax=Burkholderia lata (strain ATCC 17760 / DSM 23089 / LMG 22485 / NCIMB 9086 / R18194 / 383) TaxID=482957 RepID=A0A6P2HFV7_BURL3|nr:integrase catalytic subunit [Burkholderia lata]